MRKGLPRIKEGGEELLRRLRTERKARRKTRLQVLYILKSGQAQSRQEVATLGAGHRQTIGRWLDAYEQGGLRGMLEIRTHANRPPVIPPPVRRALVTKLRSSRGVGSYGEAHHWLKRKWGRGVKDKTLPHLIRYRLRASLKVARPSHVKKIPRRRTPSVQTSARAG
jgi:hypothetical protein